MKRIPLAALSALCLILSPMATTASGWEMSKRKSARIIIDGVYINWGVVSAMGKYPTGGKAAVASFTREGASGTQEAGLSVSERVAFAQRALAAHKHCDFKSFDPAFNAARSNMLGQPGSTLVFGVKC